LCAKERVFWLFANERINFFSTKINREVYRSIYNYYMSSYSHNSYLEKNSLTEFIGNSNLVSSFSYLNGQRKKIIDVTLQELDNLKKFLFLLKYE